MTIWQLEMSEVLQYDEEVVLVPGLAKYTWKSNSHPNSMYKEVHLNQFDLNLDPYMVAGFKNKSIEVRIPMKRLPEFHGITTFMPTIFLFIISCSILFIKQGHFEATVALALTAMLVMMTLHQSVSDDLPKTAKVKLIDVWLIAGMIVPFTVFLVVIVLELIPDSDMLTNKKSARQRSQSCCKMFIPTATFLFVLVYFAYTIYVYF